MKYTNIQNQIPENFADNARVWIYQNTHSFTDTQKIQIENKLNEFVAHWQSHGVPIKGFAKIFYNQFIIILADETNTKASGCSIDSAVRVIKEIENEHQINLFERNFLTFFRNENIEIIPISQLEYAFQNNLLHEETLFFDNTILTKEALLNRWIVPIKNSWLAKRMAMFQQTASN